MLLENSAQSIAECYVEVNDKFGPTLQGDCGGDTFDFTLLFEQSILSLGPSLLLLLTFPLRTYVLLRRAPVTTPSFFHRLKLVPGNPIYLVNQLANIALGNDCCIRLLAAGSAHPLGHLRPCQNYCIYPERHFFFGRCIHHWRHIPS